MSVIPGSFPQQELQEPPGPVSESASKAVEQEELEVFAKRHDGHNKTRYQITIIKQLQSLIYILIAFQFLKYCHSACIVPVIIHASSQLLLSCGSLTFARSRAELTWLPAMINAINQTPGLQDWEKEKRQSTIFRRVCWYMYAKTFFVGFYHGLVVTWLVLIANDNNLAAIEHGSWWFVSFIGESTPSVLAVMPWYKKMVVLGLPQLLITDVLIMILQLVLFQCVFRQSTLTYLGRRLNDETLIIRTSMVDPVSPIPHINQAPMVLRVRLYESLRKEAVLDEE